MSRPASVSVIIPSFNRKDSLLRALAGLDAQTALPSEIEVVVVDDGSTDGTAEAVEAARYGFALKLLRQSNGGPARARNRGIEEATGELVLFMDDDIAPDPGLIDAHVATHAESSAERVVIGPLASLPHYEQPWVAWEQAKLEAQYAAMLRGDWAPSFRQFWTGNASVRRSHLVDLGGFDPSYPRGEDVELGRRLHERGLEFVFNPRAIGLHHARRSLESWMSMHAHYGRLEVDTMGGLGEEEMLKILAENYARLHRANRAVLAGMHARPAARRLLIRGIRRWLTSSAARHTPLATSRLCSVLANLLYWEASAQALGPDRFRQVLRHADALLTNDPHA